MFSAPQVDVIVPVDCALTMVLPCLESVLEHSGPGLRRLIVIEDHGQEPATAAALDCLAHRDDRVCVAAHPRPLGSAGSCNRGLAARAGDAVLLSGDCIVGRDWLAELAAVAHAEERTACASPLMNAGGTCAVLEPNRTEWTDPIDPTMVRAACAGLPRWTVAPVLAESCIYLRGDVVDAVGLLDPSLTSRAAAIHDWVLRARTLGFVAKRANHIYVHRQRPLPDPGAVAEPPQLEHELKRFGTTLDGRLAAHAVRWQATGKLRAALDLRHLPREQIGTRTYAVGLARALAGLPELDLTLLVNDPAQARGLGGRVVTTESWSDDVMVVHKPAQVIDPRELGLLFGSSSHVIITYQDLIGYHIPQVFPTDAEHDRYRATSRLGLPAAQGVIAYSESTARELAAEFGIPREEIAVVPLGVDSGWFAHRGAEDAAIFHRLGVPSRYYLSLATDFPHKNLPSLLDAYALLRRRWCHGEPPGLVLAGYRTGARTGFYAGLESRPTSAGLTFLGPVSPDQLRVLYQHAVALVFPSLYEGFGLPPLEAMAAGTPVIALPISSVPEVGGDGVLYPDGLSIDDLARAMERVATDEDLRDELEERGLRRVEQFRWETTGRATLEVYRSAVLSPSPRALQMRRNLEAGIRRWAEDIPQVVKPVALDGTDPAEAPELQGIRNACRALNSALSRRLRRELGRLHPLDGRWSA